MKEDLDWLWDNINRIYVEKGENYECRIKDLSIISNDNYFDCIIENNYNFRISIEYSFTGNYKIDFKPYNYGNVKYGDQLKIDFYISKLIPIFRDYKINDII